MTSCDRSGGRSNDRSDHHPLVVVAIGGNSLIKDGAHQSVPDQYQAICDTCANITSIIENGWRVVITHGNGPQVGFILMRSEIARKELHEVPLESCVADSQGAIGYQIQQALANEFSHRKLAKRAVTVVTQVVVDANDRAFAEPSKPIGPFYTQEQAAERQKNNGWTMVEDAGRGYRRVVASPRPVEILEADVIRQLVEGGTIVVAAGGGGVPVTRDARGDLRGVAAVIDKDYASALLAAAIHADTFLITTAVDAVYLNFGKPDQKQLSNLSLEEARRYLAEGHFRKGSMAPKVEACIQFLESGGEHALITSPARIQEALSGKAGTHFR